MVLKFSLHLGHLLKCKLLGLHSEHLGLQVYGIEMMHLNFQLAALGIHTLMALLPHFRMPSFRQLPAFWHTSDSG